MVIHDVGAKHPEHSIVAIENGHVTGRKVGDGASHVVLEQVRQADAQPSDHLSYLTKTPDGKILKSSTMYIRGRSGKVAAILGINYDISSLLMVEDAVHELIDTKDKTQGEPEKIVNGIFLNIEDGSGRLSIFKGTHGLPLFLSVRVGNGGPDNSGPPFI